MKDAILVKNPMPVINVFIGQPLCPPWPGIKGANMMKINLVENMSVNYVAKVSSHQTVLKNICLHIVISKGSHVTFVANNSKMTHAIEGTWFVFMDKSTLVKSATKISQL